MEQFAIYDKLDAIELSALTERAGNTELPKNKRYVVNCNGVEIKVQLSFAKVGEKAPQLGFDAFAAIDSLYCRRLKKEEIFWETNGDPQYGDPQFDKSILIPLSWGQVDKRNRFIIAIANLINNQETIEGIVQSAPKKNGMLQKNKVVKIASSGMSYPYEQVFAIVGIAKQEDMMSITFAPVDCAIGDNEKWANDFISVYHPGLPVSEALKEMFDDA